MGVFSSYKKGKPDFDKLAGNMKSANSSKKDYTDDRFYYPKRDPDGNGFAIIRFLPDVNYMSGEDNESVVNFSKRMSHGVKGPGGWYIENCPTTLEAGAKCPACESNSAIVNAHGGWKSTPKAKKDFVSQRSRRTEFVANILVIKDPENPEFEGKVFLFRFGKTIFDMQMDSLDPKFDDDPKFDPYNIFSGHDFKLKIVKLKGQTTYERSAWAESPSDMSDNYDLDEIAEKLYDVHELVSPDKFESYTDLVNRWNRVTGESITEEGTAEPEAAQESAEPASSKTAEASDVGSLEDDIPESVTGGVVEDSGGDDDDLAAFFEASK